MCTCFIRWLLHNDGERCGAFVVMPVFLHSAYKRRPSSWSHKNYLSATFLRHPLGPRGRSRTDWIIDQTEPVSLALELEFILIDFEHRFAALQTHKEITRQTGMKKHRQRPVEQHPL